MFASTGRTHHLPSNNWSLWGQAEVWELRYYPRKARVDWHCPQTNTPPLLSNHHWGKATVISKASDQLSNPASPQYLPCQSLLSIYKKILWASKLSDMNTLLLKTYACSSPNLSGSLFTKYNQEVHVILWYLPIIVSHYVLNKVAKSYL